MEVDQRILVLMPTLRDSERTARALGQAGLSYYVCRDIHELCQEIERGAALALLAEEAIQADRDDCLQHLLGRQPPWSDFPLVLLAQSQGRGDQLRESMNATLVERPVKLRSLLSVVRAALRSRRHQYAVRDHLEKRKRDAEALQQADRRKDEFLAMLAHELRNPLAPLRNSINILQLTAAADMDRSSLYETMERQVNYLVRLVDDLLEVSRITRGKIELRIEPVEIAAVARNAIETSRPLIDAAGLQLAISLPAERLVVDGDFVRLSQVFSNLLNNAAKYTNPGGQIWFNIRRDGDEVVLAVRDTGIGIPQELLPRVFDMFMQVDRATDRAQGGLGIGLTLVRSLVELHGGRIEATSEGRDRGSEFIVHLPLSKIDHPVPDGESSPSVPRALPARRVLVVDDNVDSALTLGTLLRFLGADVQVAHDGPAALATIERYRPDVVLLDLGMPGMDGFEVARRIRDRSELDRILLIALTGWGQEDDRRRTRDAGFDHHLVKPVDVSTLQAFFGPEAESRRH